MENYDYNKPGKWLLLQNAWEKVYSMPKSLVDLELSQKNLCVSEVQQFSFGKAWWGSADVVSGSSPLTRVESMSGHIM